MFELDEKKIRGLMIEHELTIRALARKARITEVTASRLSRKGARATARTLGKIAKAFGVNGEELILKEGVI